MATVNFTPALRRHVDCPTETIEGATVRDVLDRYFARYPRVRSYVLDEQGAVRHHVVVFVDGVMVRDRAHLAQPVRPDATIDVMQALSGG